MRIRGLFQNIHVARITGLFAVLTMVVVLVNIFVVGGGQFFNTLNSFLPAVAALLTSYFSYRFWADKKDPVARPFWYRMAWAFGLWGMAEVIWAFYNVALQVDVPYPSLADLLWTVGYIPLYGALIVRMRTLKMAITRRQLALIIGLDIILLLVVCVFILAPMIQSWDSSRWLESVTNIIYPVCDLGMVLLVSLILIRMQAGRFAITWYLIFTGIMIMTLSDQVFSYASWNGLYYLDGQVNLLTNLSDTSYTLAYFLIGYGIFLYRVVWDIKDAFKLNIKNIALPRYYAYIATNQKNEIITYSNNLYYLVKDPHTTDYYKQPVEQALRVDPDFLKALLHHIQWSGMVVSQPVVVRARDGEVRKAWITGVASYNPGNPGPEFAGINMALRADLPVDPPLLLPDNKEIMGMLRYLQEITETHPEDRIQAIRAYFQETIELFALMLYQFEGEKSRKALFEALAQTIQQQALMVKINGQEIELPDFEEAEELARTVSALLLTARRFTVNLLGEQIVNHDYQEFEKQFNSKTLQNLEQLQLRLVN